METEETTAPAEAPKKKSRTGWVIAAGVVLFVVLAGIAVAVGAGGDDEAANQAPADEPANPPPSRPTTTRPRPTTTTTAPPVVPTAADFSIALTVTRQQCFGSAGCNVTVKPELTISHTFDESVDITYTIDGDESGPIIETLTLTPDGQYQSHEVSMSTSSSGVVPTATITLVS